MDQDIATLKRRKACEDAMSLLVKTWEGRELIRHLLETSRYLKAQYYDVPQFASFVEGMRYVGSEIMNLANATGAIGQILGEDHE